METRLYRTGEFAKRARVSVRTLRYYDREGILSPSERSLSGHRLYSDADLVVLGRILGLKLLGFTLAEIRAFLNAEPEGLSDALARQRAMLEERQAQIHRAIRTIGEVEAKVRAGTWDWDAIQQVVEVMQMNEDRTWVQRHLTPAQLEAVQEISNRAYPTEAYNALRDRTWTEEDQARLTEEWNEVFAEADRLAKAGVDPASPEGRALGLRYKSLVEAFTLGDPTISQGLQQFYQEAKNLPPGQSPFPPETWEAMRYAHRACEAVEKG